MQNVKPNTKVPSSLLFIKQTFLSGLHYQACNSLLDTAGLHRFDDPEQIFTYCLKRWCIFFHTKAVDQRDVAEQGSTYRQVVTISGF